MSTFTQDLRYAVRAFLRSPRFTIPAVLALGLGIGATSATFSVIRGVMLKPLPYDDPDRIVIIWENNLRRNFSRNVIGPANFIAWRERNTSFEHLGMIGPARLNMMLGGQPEEVEGMVASSDLFPILGVQPMIGRAYTAHEDERGNDNVIVFTYEFWQSRLGGRADLVGSTVNVNGRPVTVVGIMPPGFTVLGRRAHFFTPYGWTLEQLRSARGRGSSFGIARLRDGVSFEQADAEMHNIAAQLEKEAPDRNAGWSVALVPVHEQMIEEIRPALNLLAGAVALVLLVACVNVANLLLARSTVRQQELGIRVALGAGRGRLVRQLLSENVLLGIAGGAAGLLLAVLFHRGLLALVSARIPVPRIDQVALDLPVLLFTVGLSVATGLFFGLAPALLATHAPSESLREGGRHGGTRRSRRALSLLVVAEVALSLVLLAGAGLLIRSFIRLQNIDSGINDESMLTARVRLPGVRYDEPAKITAFFSEVLKRTSALPGVRNAAGVTFLPLSGPGIGTSYHDAALPAPLPGQSPTGEVRPVTPNFFRTMGIPQIAGRDFTESDTADSPRVAIITETLARRHFSQKDPLGQRLEVFIGDPSRGPYEIVGVVGDIKFTSLESETRPGVFIPHAQLPIGFMTLVVKTDVDPSSIVSSVAAQVRALDPELPLSEVRTMEEVVDSTLARPRIVAVLLTVFALLALVLAAVGVYGVMAYSVAQRTREIGVRIALGATHESVFRLVLTEALRLVAVGVVSGLVIAAVFARFLDTLLYETEPLDPVTFGATAMLLVVVATLASYVPARRGTRIEPVEALRE
jgi:putative ABC transport system permease protein